MIQFFWYVIPAISGFVWLHPLPGFAESPPDTETRLPSCQGYLYVEPFRSRFELLMDLPTALNQTEFSFPEPHLAQNEVSHLVSHARSHFSSWLSVKSNSVDTPATLQLVQALLGKPGSTYPVKDGDPLPLLNSMLAMMWEFPTSALPEEITLKWNSFAPDVIKIPVTIHFGSEVETSELTLNNPILQWKNLNRMGAPPPLLEIPTINQSEPTQFHLTVIAGLICIVFALILCKALPSHRRIVFLLCLVGLVCSFFIPRFILLPPIFSKTNAVTPESASEVIEPLIRNVYRAFDQRDEETIYDLLAHSADGPLLRDLYLDVLSHLSLDENEAARVTVSEVATELMELRHEDGGFRARTSWSALGSVGHWGHSHTRWITCEAWLTVAVINHQWKITDIEILDRRRL